MFRLYPILLSTVLVLSACIGNDVPKNITAENAGQLIALLKLDTHKNILALDWSPDGNTLAVATNQGVWLYNTNHIDIAPYLIGNQSVHMSSIAFSPTDF